MSDSLTKSIRDWSSLSEYVDAILTSRPGNQMCLDTADFSASPHDVLTSVAIMCARRAWGEPDTWILSAITAQQWHNFVTQFRCTGWDICGASTEALLPCVSCSDTVPGLFLWQNVDVPKGVNVKKIDVPNSGPLFLWCVPCQAQ